MKYLSCSIIFQEIPNEVTIGINITNCPFRCDGCHSSILQQDVGTELNEDVLLKILEKYHNSVVTCICFFGGDGEPEKINEFAKFLKKNTRFKVAWYSGCDEISEKIELKNFDFIKIGHYDKLKGSLLSKNTNQIFYSIEDGKLVNKTRLFWKLP